MCVSPVMGVNFTMLTKEMNQKLRTMSYKQHENKTKL